MLYPNIPFWVVQNLVGIWYKGRGNIVIELTATRFGENYTTHAHWHSCYGEKQKENELRDEEDYFPRRLPAFSWETPTTRHLIFFHSSIPSFHPFWLYVSYCIITFHSNFLGNQTELCPFFSMTIILH